VRFGEIGQFYQGQAEARPLVSIVKCPELWRCRVKCVKFCEQANCYLKLLSVRGSEQTY
jgi:hypothetical protein